MVYICRVYADGNPEDRVVFDTYISAFAWARKHARRVPPICHGWDTTYIVKLYGSESPDVDLATIEPIEIISPD